MWLHNMNFARAWMGFDYQKNCGNIEDPNENWINSTKIVAEWRDKFPKLNLDGGYIGDRVHPLRKDLPSKMFLTTKATYRSLGGSKLPKTMHANLAYPDNETIVDFEPDASLQLRAALCSGAGLNCLLQPPANKIVLTSTLPCTPGTTKCSTDAIRVVKVTEGWYWEYVHPPCIKQEFFHRGRKVGLRYGDMEGAQCVNPSLPAAFEACCKFPPRRRRRRARRAPTAMSAWKMCAAPKKVRKKSMISEGF